MSFFITIAIKLALGLVSLVFVINVTGKGNLAPSSTSDQIINYVFGGIMGSAIYNSSVRIPDFIVVLCIWCVFVLWMKWVKARNVRAKQLIDGKALIIIDDGKIDITNCKKARLSAHDVAFKLRTNGIYSSKAVKRALVEQNGQFIIIQAGEENPKFPIITDGHIQNDILEVIGKDEKWLMDELRKQGIDKYSEVFLGEYVDNSLIVTTYK